MEAQNLQDFEIKFLYYLRWLKHWELTDDRVIEYVSWAEFLIPSRFTWVRLDRPLLTALIERWRSETSTFHLREGEMIVTLQDVAVLLRLCIDGPPVTVTDERNWAGECADWWAWCLPDDNTRWTGEADIVAWAVYFASNYIVEAQQHARAYILHMIGTQLFPDYSKNKVYLRWLSLLEDFDVCGAMS